MSQTDSKKKAMLLALEKTLGVVTPAAKSIGIDRRTHYRWIESDPEYKAGVEDMPEIALDFAESQLYKQMKNDNTTAIIFYLKTKGKDRGYIERRETDLNIKQASTLIIEQVDEESTDDTD